MSRLRDATILLLLASVPAAAQQRDWLRIDISGSPVGWMWESQLAFRDSTVTAGAMHIALNRLGSRVVVASTQSSMESPDGRLRRMEYVTRMAQQEVGTLVTLADTHATVRVTAGGRSFDRVVPLKHAPVGPAAMRTRTIASLRAAGDSIQFATWDPQAGAPATVTRTLTTADSLLHVTERSSASPVVTTIWLSRDGRTVRTEFDLPFGRTVAVRTDSATAMAAGQDGSLSAESYARTLARTNIRLPRAREIERLRLRLTLTDSGLRLPDLSGPGQRMIAREGVRGVIEISRRHPRRADTIPRTVTPALREYAAPNAYVQSDDPALVSLARSVVGTERDALAAALLLRRWVADNMTLDLGIAFATSREVLERRRGTCVAYATLLAALTRAVGIPSRVAMGYVYVNGALGGHLWTEVLIGDEWIPIDAAVVSDRSADAARFAFAWSSLADGPGPLVSGAATALYGHLHVAVEEFELDGRRVTVPPDAAPWRIDGNVYRNPWVGVEVTAPPGWSFARLDEVWPSNVVVALERGDDEARVVLRSRLPWSQEPIGDGNIVRASERWSVEADGPDAERVIPAVRQGLRLQ